MIQRLRYALAPASLGVAIGAFIALLTITTIVVSNPVMPPDVFFILAVWALSLFVGAAAALAVAIHFRMSHVDKEEWRARHAQSPAGRV